MSFVADFTDDVLLEAHAPGFSKLGREVVFPGIFSLVLTPSSMTSNQRRARPQQSRHAAGTQFRIPVMKSLPPL